MLICLAQGTAHTQLLALLRFWPVALRTTGAMAAPPEIMSRLGCARMVLLAAHGTPNHASVSKLQADAVIDVMEKKAADLAKMTPDMRARMCSLASSAEWDPTDLGKIIALISKEKKQSTRSKMQKYTPTILDYFTAAEWAQMKGKNVVTAMDFLITRLHQLGGEVLVGAVQSVVHRAFVAPLWDGPCDRELEAAGVGLLQEGVRSARAQGRAS